MKHLTLIITAVLISINSFGQHPTIRSIALADTIDVFNDPSKLNLVYNHWILVDEDVEDWLNYEYKYAASDWGYSVLNIENLKSDYGDEIYDIIKLEDDELWGYVLKTKSHIEYENNIYVMSQDYYISKGGNAVLLVTHHNDGRSNKSFWYSDTLLNT